jgi:hypothetical protein
MGIGDFDVYPDSDDPSTLPPMKRLFPRTATARDSLFRALVTSCALAACSHSSADSTADVAAAATATASAAPSASASPSVVDQALSFLSGGKPFEGEITTTMTRAGKPPMVLVFTTKGTKGRFSESPSTGDVSYVIEDFASNKATTVSDSKKTAMVMSTDGIYGAYKGKKITPVATGASKVVLGYSCDVYQIPGGGGPGMDASDKGEACVAKGLRFPQQSNPWLTEVNGGDAFPMVVSWTDATGKEKSHWEVTKVDKRSPDDSLFVVPAGYKTQSIDDVLKGLGNGGKPPGKGRPHK